MKQSGVVCWTGNANSIQRLHLAENLLEVCPARTDRVVFLTTGTEAVEGALRIMRRASFEQGLDILEEAIRAVCPKGRARP